MYVFVFWFQICIINKNEFLIVNYCNPPTLLSLYQITAREQISDKRGLMAVRVNVIRGSAIRMMKSKRCYSWLKWSIDVTMINRIVIWAVFGEIGLEISVIKHTDQQKEKKRKKYNRVSRVTNENWQTSKIRKSSSGIIFVRNPAISITTGLNL